MARIAARRAARLVLRFVDLERAAIEVLAVERFLRARGVRARHLDESEAAGTAGVAIGDQRNLLHRAVIREKGSNGIFGGRERQVSNIEFGHEKSRVKKWSRRRAMTRRWFERL